ncbi:hypothetical protein ACROYT_G004655 [Oculina patagonica]
MGDGCLEEYQRHKFYLAFENSLCVDYITEKYWRNSLERGLVPIVLGGARYSPEQGDCLYACETWRVTKASNNRMQTFRQSLSQAYPLIQWQDKVRNEDLWKRAEHQPLHLARPYAEKALCQCHQACPSMDTSGKKEPRKA